MRRVGENGLVHRQERRVVNFAYPRLLLVCAAFALGETLALGTGAFAVAVPIGVVFGAAAYILTQDIGRGGGGGGRGGQGRYWRGRRIDDDKRRWN
jgi:hypothetical protein